MIPPYLNPRWLLGGAAALAILGMGVTLHFKNQHIAKIEAERDNNATQLAWATELLTVQSKAVDDLHAQRAEDRKVYLAGLQAANGRAIKLEVDAERILALPTPATSDEQCTAAEALLRKELTR